MDVIASAIDQLKSLQQAGVEFLHRHLTTKAIDCTCSIGSCETTFYLHVSVCLTLLVDRLDTAMMNDS